MPDNILFYLLFSTQLILLSYYYPSKIIKRIRLVHQLCPRETHPRLYSQANVNYDKGLQKYRLANAIILVLGVVLMFFVGYWDSQSVGKTGEAFPIFFGLFQFMPFFFMEFLGFKELRNMRNNDQRKIKKADLKPRLFSQYAPMNLVGLTIASYLLCIGFELYIADSVWQMKTLTIIITLTLCNLLYMGIIFWHLHGNKLDPYQSSDDRRRQTKIIIKSLLITSIATSVYFTGTAALQHFQLERFEITLNCFYMLIIAVVGVGFLLKEIRVEEINFDVYKADYKA
ncbi:hypothetical protein QX776_10110 [Alteromonadaceae bacterium BrNp21-10]|nr:hypothetical protein [Alteromonadaceae bacterium BrNp21-10]